MKSRAVTVVGIGDDGCVGLTSRAVDAVARARVLVGGERQLAFFPEFGGEKLVLKSGISALLDRVAELAEDSHVCVLASGDPLFFGIGGLLVKRLGREHVAFVPQPSAMQWAFARAGVAWDDAELISLHGRPRTGLLSRLRNCRKAALFTDGENSPQRIAMHLIEHGQRGFSAVVCENLCGPDERVREFALSDLAACDDIAPLNVLLLLRSDPAFRSAPVIAYLPEDEFARRMPKKGLITKREIRLLSIAQLGLRSDSVVWDIGAGSGSLAIEAALLASRGRVYAIEVDPEGVEICHENVRHHGTDHVTVIAGRAPEALAELEAPDAVFIGGSKGSMAEIVNTAFERLKPGGRLVANAITLENAHETYQAMRKLGIAPEVTLVQISRGEPLARYMRYEALNPIQIFAVTKPLPAAVVEGET